MQIVSLSESLSISVPTLEQPSIKHHQTTKGIVFLSIVRRIPLQTLPIPCATNIAPAQLVVLIVICCNRYSRSCARSVDRAKSSSSHTICDIELNHTSSNVVVVAANQSCRPPFIHPGVGPPLFIRSRHSPIYSADIVYFVLVPSVCPRSHLDWLSSPRQIQIIPANKPFKRSLDS